MKRDNGAARTGEFSPAELRSLRALKSPAGIQRFLDGIPYHLAGTAWSPRKVLHEKTAHCLEGAIFAAAALRVLGFPPLIFDLEADQDTDHVLAIFKMRGHWGAIAKSNFAGCRYREPVYRTLRELALSYFNTYFNLRGERTLRRYSQPVNLARFDNRHWMTAAKGVWFIAEYLCDIPHRPLLKRGLEKNLTRVDRANVGERNGRPPEKGVKTSRESGRVFGLDLLRAAAIMMVICAHGFVVLYPHFGQVLGYFGHGGFYGVELFFVLSGFLIGQILIRNGSDLGRAGNVAFFYVRRWFRTLPLFFLFLIINIAFERLFRAHPVGLSEGLSHGFFLRNFASFRMTFFPESWSLAIEEWFYLLFPAALWLGLKTTKRFDAVFLSAAFSFLAFSTVARLLAAPDPAATWSEELRMVVIYRFDALMIGMIGAWLSIRFPQPWRRSALLCALAGIVLLVAMYATLWRFENGQLAFGDDNYFARTFRFTLVSIGFALLLPWASAWKLAGENFTSIAVRRIALWSYGLYLVHLPVFLLVTRAGFGADSPMSLGKALASFALQIGGAILLSALLYRFFEAPSTRLREKAAPAVAKLFPSS